MLINNSNRLFFSFSAGKVRTIDFVFCTIREILCATGATLLGLFLYSCKKMVEIDQPINSLTTEGTFSNDATANAAVLGIYSKLINTGGSMFASGGTTIFSGLSADELTKAGIGGTGLEFYSNNILTNNATLINQLWSPAYFAVYDANTCIEGLEKSESLTPALKTQLIGECKFLRAFSFFYLANSWGDIPMPLTGNWEKIYLLTRTSKSEVYKQILSDLNDAQSSLGSDYAYSVGEKLRANKFAATALLARVNLYRKEWANAETQASTVINSGLFVLNTNLNDVFFKK